jgi:small subunit ribosomal protein S16
MLKLRLKKIGRKKQPTYRLVVVPNSTKRNGRFIDNVGYYNPITKKLSIQNEKIIYWLKNGVQPTLTIQNLLKKAKIISL